MHDFRTLLLALTGLGIAALSASSSAVMMVAIDDKTPQKVFLFDSATPRDLVSCYAIVGLQANDKLIGIDVRPADDQIYGVTYSGRVYTLNPVTGVAVQVSTLMNSATGFPLQMNGTEFAIDFDPVNDRLHVISHIGQNLKIVVETGVTTVLPVVSYSNTSDKPLFHGIAYTNPDTDPMTGSVLYGYDYDQSRYATESSPGSNVFAVNNSPSQFTTEVGGFDVDRSGVLYLSTYHYDFWNSKLFTTTLPQAWTGKGNIGPTYSIGYMKGLCVAPRKMPRPGPPPRIISRGGGNWPARRTTSVRPTVWR